MIDALSYFMMKLQDQPHPPQQNILYPVENPTYPGYPSVDQTYTPPTVQEPHGGTGEVTNAGIMLQE